MVSIKEVKNNRVCPIVMAFALLVVLYSPFVPFAINDSYFRLYPLSFGIAAICALSALVLLKKGKRKMGCFQFPDLWIIIGTVYYLFRYDYANHLADWKVMYAFLLLLFWLAVRFIFTVFPAVKFSLSVGTAVLGCLLGLWGVAQLYGWAAPGHAYFRITGPFFNPGPYAGYLAMLFPICLHGALRSIGCLRVMFVVSLLLMLCILPASMSRSAWIAAIVSGLWVVGMEKEWGKYLKTFCNKNKWRKIGLVTMFGFLFTGVVIGLFYLKADSARGRLLIWKNSLGIVFEQPLTGYGVGCFPSVYGEAQASFFASGKASLEEERVAGQVEFAFNDYLQLLMEGGILLLFVCLVWGVTVFRCGVAIKAYGYCGALLSFAIFALSSYPLQILPFGVAVMTFGAACLSAFEKEKGIGRSYRVQVLSFLLCMGGGMMLWKVRNLPELYRQWQGADILYHQSVYDVAAKEYGKLYTALSGHHDFLRRYASALFETGHALEACRVLEREKQVSCDPMIWNTQGRYYQSAGSYQKAESCYKYALLLAPERLYPYYLLAKLYSEKDFFHKELALKMARIVQTKPPKVNSFAVDEMRLEMDSLYKQINY